MLASSLVTRLARIGRGSRACSERCSARATQNEVDTPCRTLSVSDDFGGCNGAYQWSARGEVEFEGGPGEH